MLMTIQYNKAPTPIEVLLFRKGGGAYTAGAATVIGTGRKKVVAEISIAG